MEDLVYSDGLAVSMAIMSTILLLLVMLVFLTGLMRKKETTKDTILMCNMMFAFCMYALFQMISVVLQTLVEKDNNLRDSASKWCKFVGAIGIFAFTLSLGATLIFAFHLLYDQVQSETSKRNKHTFIKVSLIIQYVLLISVAVIPCLPFDSFEAAMPCNEQTLCLPLSSPDGELKVWTMSLFVMDVLTALVTIGILVFVSYRMHRQQSLLAAMIPMEARVLRKKATKVKRIGLLLLTVLAFRLPGVGALLGLSVNISIQHTTIQWVFGLIVPLGGVVACFIYLVLIGCKKSLQKRCFKYRPQEYEAQVESLSGNRPVSPNYYSSTDGDSSVVPYDKSPTKPKSMKRLFSGTIPGEVSWIREAIIPDGFKGRYGIVEWQTANGSPRRGLMKVFPPSQYKAWTWESSTLAKLNKIGHHSNIVDFMWATTSTNCRVEQQGTENNPDELKLERYLCTAFYQHGTLREVIRAHPKKFQENLAHNVLLQISKGILFLHDHNMSHQDLNTKNIHVGGKFETMTIRVVITNFGKAMDLSKQQQKRKEEFSDFTLYQEIDLVNDGNQNKKPNDSTHMVVEEVQRLYANDIRAFSLIMLELLETVRLHFLPKEVCVRLSQKNNRHSLVPEISIPRLPSEEYDFRTSPALRKYADEGIGDNEYTNNSSPFREDDLPTAAEMNLNHDTPKRNSVCSSDSGISSNRASMRSKGSSVGNSFSKKGQKQNKGVKEPKPKISRLSQIKRRASAREAAEVETDTTEVPDSSNSSVEELDRVGYLPNFSKDRRSENEKSLPTPPPQPPPPGKSKLDRKHSLPPIRSSTTTDQLGRRDIKSVNLEEDKKVDPGSSILPRSSNSFSKFYVIRSSDGRRTNGNDSTASPRVHMKHRSSPIQEHVMSESESDTRSTTDDVPLSAIGKSFCDGTPNYNSLPRGSRVAPEDRTMQAYQSSNSRRKSDFAQTNITPGVDMSLFGQHSLPRKYKKQYEEKCPSNLTNRHMLQCQEMLSIMDGLRAVTLMNRIHVKEDCHKLVMRWLASQKTDTCLYKQMTQILKSAWTREPPYIAGMVYKKLDNCLTEVDI